MKPFTKDNGTITKQKVKEYFGTQKEIYILVISEMIKQTDLEYTNMSTEVVMKDSGSMTSNKDKEKKFG
jgi:hypothetical protein